MHELSLINSLLNKIHQVAALQAPAKPQQVTVQLGALAHISAEHFREHFVQATAGTDLQNIALNVEEDTDIHADSAQDILLKSIDFTEG